MLETCEWDVIIIGSGPAGLAASAAARDRGARVCVIEREERAGGILKQCIHDGFGLIRFKENLTGPEYACRYLNMVKARKIPIFLNTFLLNICTDDAKYTLTLINSGKQVFYFSTPAIIMATGCREMTARQIFIHGTRPSGVFTAGLAQYFVNVLGYMPTKRCVILGSGDIGLIMARRLTLEGARVKGVYEIKPEPSGLTRNVVQCLEDYKIPLYLNSTVTKVHGKDRVEGVSVCMVDESRTPLNETERCIDCDALILSVGLIPENDAADTLGIEIDSKTKGPVVDQNLMTTSDGIFSCGNALHVNDLVDYVSESGDRAGTMAAAYASNRKDGRKLMPLIQEGDLLYAVPHYFDLNIKNNAIIYFRSSKTLKNAVLQVYSGDQEYIVRKYRVIKPPEMQRVTLDLSSINPDIEEIKIKLNEEG